MPHHHHHGEVCIVSSHCTSDNHKNKDVGHEHDRENSSQCCVLTQIVVLPSNLWKHHFEDLACPEFRINGFRAVLLNEWANSLFPSQLVTTQRTFISLTYFFYTNSGLGLRAPPIV